MDSAKDGEMREVNSYDEVKKMTELFECLEAHTHQRNSHYPHACYSSFIQHSTSCHFSLILKMCKACEEKVLLCFVLVWSY